MQDESKNGIMATRHIGASLFPTLPALAFSGMLLLSSCGKENPGLSLGEEQFLHPYNQTSAISTKQGEVLSYGNAFALDLTRSIHTDNPSDSYILSPLGVEMVLGMIYNGAGGDTFSQIVKAMGYEGVDRGQINELYNILLGELPSSDPKTTVEIANAILVRDGLTLREDYFSTVSNYYEAFVKSAPMDLSTVKEVNEWCSDKTHGMIPEVLDKLDQNTVSILMNALYFKGEWTSQFDESKTRDEKFTASSGKKVTVPMMHMSLTTTLYYENENFQKVCLNYGNGDYSILLFLPREKSDIGSLLRVISPESLSHSSISGNAFTVDLYLPRFETESSHKLIETLSSLGIEDLFSSSKCDLSGMGEQFDDVYIGEFFQKAKIKVNEKGSEAAAVTVAIGIKNSVGPAPDPIPVTFKADRPFLYSIISNNTGAILFTGAYQGD